MSLIPSEIERTDKFKKMYHELDSQIKKKLDRKLGYLKQDVFHSSLRTEHIKKTKDYWKFKVDDNYECVFALRGSKVSLMIVVDHNTFDKTF